MILSLVFLACLDHPPKVAVNDDVPHAVYNIGNNNPEPLMRFIETLETAIGKKAEKKFLPMQAGDVQATFADISPMQKNFGFKPTTPIDVGIPKFVNWYRQFHKV